MATKFVSADAGLDPRQFHELNVRFYEGYRKEFITTRLGLLCRLNQAPDEVEKELAEGVSWGELKLKIEPDDDSAEALRRNAELELVVLHQHTAEVLFRLFWVHAHREPCTWLGLARFRNPDQLRQAAKKYLAGELWSDDDGRRRLHITTMWGASAVLEDGTPREARLGESADTVALWIAVAAETVQSAPLYNAYKHGLAVVTHDSFTLTFGADRESPEPLTMKGGSGFSYIERVTDQAKREHKWQFVREPVDFEVMAAETAVFSNLLGPILAAGAVDRGVTTGPKETTVPNAAVTPDHVRNMKAESGIFVQRWADSLLYLQ